MKNFLKYVGVFSASLILLIIGVEYMLRQVPNALAFKKELIEKHTQDTKNLIIGSSVVNCGINPAYLADSTYNLAISGEWFRFNQILLEKYIQQLPQLKNVFWGICFHSLWSDDNENTDISSIVNHQIYMGISRNHNKLHNIELLSLGSLCMRKWSKYYIQRRPTMRCDSLGVDHSYDSKFKDNNWLEDIPDLVADQHKPMLADTNGDLYHENISRMHQIAQVCKSKGITLYLVMPPVHPTYFQLMNQEQLTLIHNAITESSFIRYWSHKIYQNTERRYFNRFINTKKASYLNSPSSRALIKGLYYHNCPLVLKYCSITIICNKSSRFLSRN